MASRYIHVENTVDKAWMKIVRHGAHGRYIIDCTLHRGFGAGHEVRIHGKHRNFTTDFTRGHSLYVGIQISRHVYLTEHFRVISFSR
jgi:hypothetical protein